MDDFKVYRMAKAVFDNNRTAFDALVDDASQRDRLWREGRELAGK